MDDDDEAKDEFKVYESGVVGSLARARFEWWREIRVRVTTNNRSCANTKLPQFRVQPGSSSALSMVGTSFCTSDSLSLSLTS